MAFELKKNLILDVKRDQGKHWVIVGAGGNGAYFIRDFMRQVKLQNDRLASLGCRQHKVTIIDADAVEDKNLIRQNFIRNDIGHNKAQAMADRYGKAFGMPINYVSEYITDSEHLYKIAISENGRPVFIGAVDNNKTRKIIYDTYKDISEAFWIDAGNEEWGGQVVCGYNHSDTASLMYEKEDGPLRFRLPCLIDIYPEVYDAQDKLPNEMSCAERTISAPQNVFTNLTAANLMLGFAYGILAFDGRIGEGLKCHAVSFNTKNLMSFTTRYNHLDLLQSRFDHSAYAKAKLATEKPLETIPAPAIEIAAKLKKSKSNVVVDVVNPMPQPIFVDVESEEVPF